MNRIRSRPMVTIRSAIASRSESLLNDRCIMGTWPVFALSQLLVTALLTMFLFRVLLPISLLLGIPLSMAQNVHSAVAEEKIRFSVAAITGSYMDEFVAIEKGYHREEGLT